METQIAATSNPKKKMSRVFDNIELPPNSMP
ncbi:hypothetical protein COLO4_19456 [Corchorus olitorius]|uniref:Uncharacterized protein n=1 Tax=Corchorus olitorius TaxID=93759 RepID=A0A1R3J5B2_9ROSI|nr:hypothetical protein COLO4_19456 [Corchorus olitorius]